MIKDKKRKLDIPTSLDGVPERIRTSGIALRSTRDIQKNMKGKGFSGRHFYFSFFFSFICGRSE